ncbi:MAG: ankyrin repeat domain-containing protein [Legionella longbeachae]|nr:ankyrin repeat domain-containing protein [Legionella longbeachae]
MSISSFDEFKKILSKEDKTDPEIKELKEILENSDHPWVNYTQDTGNNILHEACSFDNKIMVSNLLDLSSEEVKDKLINKINKQGVKPIHYACGFSSLEIVSNLIKNKADPKEKDKKGIPAYEYAHKNGNVIVLNYVLNELPWKEEEALFFSQGSLINKFKKKSMDAEFACNALCLAHAVDNEKNEAPSSDDLQNISLN